MANYIGGKFGQADHAKLVTPVNFPDRACKLWIRPFAALHVG